MGVDLGFAVKRQMVGVFSDYWAYLRQNKLCGRVWDGHDEIVQACVDDWRFLINDPVRIRSIGHRKWARVRLQKGWYIATSRDTTTGSNSIYKTLIPVQTTLGHRSTRPGTGSSLHLRPWKEIKGIVTGPLA